MADLELFSFEPRRHGLVEPAVQVLRLVIGEGQLANAANLPTVFAGKIDSPDAAACGQDYVDVLIDYQILTPDRRVSGQSAFEVIHAAPDATGAALRNHLLRTPPVPGRPHFQEVAVFLVSLFAFQQEQYGARATRTKFLEWAESSLPRISAADRPWLWDRGGVDALYMGFLRVDGDAVVALPAVLQLILLLKTSYRPPPLPPAAAAPAPAPAAAPNPAPAASVAPPITLASRVANALGPAPTPPPAAAGATGAKLDESDDALRIAPRGRPREPRRPTADSFKRPDSQVAMPAATPAPAAPATAAGPVTPPATPAARPIAPPPAPNAAAPVVPPARPAAPSTPAAHAPPVPAAARPVPPAATPQATRPASTPGATGAPSGGTSPSPGASTGPQRRPGPDSQRRPAAAPPAPVSPADSTVPPDQPIDLKARLKDKLRREAAESGRQPAPATAAAPSAPAAPKPPAPLTAWQTRLLGASYGWGALLFACTMLPVIAFGVSFDSLAGDGTAAIPASHWTIGDGIHLAFLYLAWSLYVLRGECVRDAGVAWYYLLVACAAGLLFDRLQGSPVGSGIAVDSPANLRLLLALLHAVLAAWVVALGVTGARILSHPAGGLVLGIALSAPLIEVSRGLAGGHGELFGPGPWFWIGVLAFPLVVIESIATPGLWGTQRPPGLLSRMLAGRLDDLPPPAPAPAAAPSAPAAAAR